MAALRERAADEEEADFDWDEELAALERTGHVFLLPIVERVMRLHRLVRTVGWDGALSLGEGTFRGWEVSFVGHALTMLADYDRRMEADHRQDVVAAMLGVPRG